MNTIRFEKLIIRNFKGIQYLEIPEFADVQNVYGENGTGKTTIADASNWLMSGKDSTDRKDFGIKPYNSDGTEKHKVDVEVEGHINNAGETIKLKRIFRRNGQSQEGQRKQYFPVTKLCMR
jgi:DNA repair protein SbcC/Rad50